MNFLAHFMLAENTPESRLGNWLGDFVKGLPWDDRFEQAIWQGIMEHRHLDVFTDSHPAWQASRDRLALENRRYAGIIIDVFYDFFLSKHWAQFSPEQNLDQFIADIHVDLKAQKSVVPKNTKRVLNAMIRQKWLVNYALIEGVSKTLSRVACACLLYTSPSPRDRG